MWKEVIKKDDRYKDFIIVDKPQPFCKMFADKDIPCVQLHTTYIFQDKIIGFCGSFKWENNEIHSLDGDTYPKDFLVLGYCWFELKGQQCLDVLVGYDW